MAEIVILEERRRSRQSGWVPFISFEERPDGCSCSDFVLGFETDVLNARLEAKPDTWGGTYHARNIIMIERVAKAHGYECVVTPTETETWVFVDFIKS